MVNVVQRLVLYSILNS